MQFARNRDQRRYFTRARGRTDLVRIQTEVLKVYEMYNTLHTREIVHWKIVEMPVDRLRPPATSALGL